MIDSTMYLDKEKCQIIESFYKKNKFAEKLNFKFLTISEGYLLVEIKSFNECMCNSLEYIHGGVIASILDSAMSIAANTINKVVVTRNINVSYIKALEPVDIKVESNVLSFNNRTILIEGRIYLNDDIIATSVGVFNSIGKLW